MAVLIKPMADGDWPEVSRIYEAGIQTGYATFETSAPSWQDWNGSHLTHSRWIAVDGDQIIGWAALSPVSDRCVYGGVAEVSVYIDSKSRGRGVGQLLLDAAIKSSEENGIWTLTAAMFRENIGSAKLHERCGFRQIGYRERIGKLNGEWKDNLLYERRSPRI